MQLSAVFFDVDGTIAETEDMHRKSFNESFKEFNLDWFWDKAIYKELINVGDGSERIKHYIKRAWPEMMEYKNLTKYINSIHKVKSEIFEDHISESDIKIRPGVLRLIKELKINLPEAKPPVGSYVATKIVGNLLYISGQISISENGELIKGKIGKDLSVDDGYKAAERCGLSIISQAKLACHGDLSKIKSCIKLTGFVNSTDDFTDQPKVINGSSDLIVSVFGDAGMHTRAAVSVNSLPLGVSVEVDAIFELN